MPAPWMLALALLWLLLRILCFGDRLSFGWDSSQFARGVAEFNILKHQPHPPGYFLWVLATGDLARFAGGPMRAQVVLAFAMALLALAVFYALARRFFDRDAALGCTILLAFSPAVALYSEIPYTTITDLAASSIAGYFAFLDPRVRQWRIVACMVALGFLAGFRQSGVMLLLPLMAGAALAHWRQAWKAVLGGTILGGLAFLDWYVPLADTVGGWRVLAQLTSQQFRVSAQTTSIFYGAPLQRHVGMIEENILYFGMNLVGWLAAFGLMAWHLRRSPKTNSFPAISWWRYALWLMPNLIVVFALHGAMVGYCLLCFPPLLLLCASLVNRNWMPAVAAGVAVSLAISYFPYGRLLTPQRYTVDYVLYRSAPRFAGDLESSQEKLDQTLHSLQQSGAPQPFVCARLLPEAPNIRTVTYDFNYVRWVTPNEAPAGTSVWLFDWRGPDAALRARYSNWRQVSADELLSVWEAR